LVHLRPDVAAFASHTIQPSHQCLSAIGPLGTRSMDGDSTDGRPQSSVPFGNWSTWDARNRPA